MLHAFARPRRLAFTLIELIITVVVLGLLAGIGILAYGQVVNRAQDRAAQLALTDVAREASALAAQNGETEWSAADFQTALADTAAGAALSGDGVSAAGRLALANAAADSTNSSSMSYGQVSLQTRAGGLAGLAMRSASGHCALVRVALPQQVTAWTTPNDVTGNCLGSTALDKGPGVAVAAGSVLTGATPLAPAGATASVSGTTVTLSWSASAGASSYAVYRSTDNGATWATLAGNLAAPGYTDSGAAAGGTYVYGITALSTNESAKTLSAPVTLAPAPVVSATATLVAGTNTATVSWPSSAGATQYTVTASTGASAIATGTTATLPIAGSTSATFTIVATNTGGSSAGVTSTPVTLGYTGVALNSGPVDYWRLNDPSGATAVDATSTANGTYSGGYTLSQPGPLKNDSTARSAMFDGATGRVNIGGTTAHEFDNGLSVAAWVYPTANSNTARIINWNNGAPTSSFADDIVLSRNGTTGGLEYAQKSATPGGSGTWEYIATTTNTSWMPLNTWTHVVLTVAPSGQVTIYVNGSVAQLTTQTGAPTPIRSVARANGYIGHSVTATTDPDWAGGFAEVGVWTRPLSAAEALALYSSATPTADLVFTSGNTACTTTTGSCYDYETLSTSGSYTIQAGDRFEYDEFLPNGTTNTAADFTTSDGTDLRDSGAVDQNGITAHPHTGVLPTSVWLHRTIAIPASLVGKTITNVDLAQTMYYTPTAHTALFDNIVITSSSGALRKDYWKPGDPLPTLTTHLIAPSSSGLTRSLVAGVDGP